MSSRHERGGLAGPFGAAAVLFVLYATVTVRAEAARPCDARSPGACAGEEPPTIVGPQAYAPELVEQYCRGSGAEHDAVACAALLRTQRDQERLDLEHIRTGPKAPDQDAQRARSYLAFWRKWGEQPCIASGPGCEGMEEVLHSAARAYQAAGLLAKAMELRYTLIDPKHHLEHTDLARRAVYEIGTNFQALAIYDSAADWYERFAKANPDDVERTPTALVDAVLLRLALGHHDRAIARARWFREHYAADHAAKAAQLTFAVGAHYAERGDWPNAERWLGPAMRQIETEAAVDIELLARAVLGRSQARLGRQVLADRSYKRLVDVWKFPAQTVERIMGLPGSERQNEQRLTKVLAAVGEAHFHFAEKRRRRAEAIKRPAYTGTGKLRDIERFVHRRVTAWMTKRDNAITDAERAYLKILRLEPRPPAKWAIRATAAVGAMWARHANELRALRYPARWDGPGESPWTDPQDPNAPPLLWAEIRAQFLASLDAKSEPLRGRARTAYETCLRVAVASRYFDEHVRSCELWLARSFPADYHLIDEFFVLPSRLGWGTRRQLPPLGAPAATAGD